MTRSAISDVSVRNQTCLYPLLGVTHSAISDGARAPLQAEEMRRQLEAARLEADRANAKAAAAAAAAEAAAEKDKKDREVWFPPPPPLVLHVMTMSDISDDSLVSVITCLLSVR